MLLLFSDLSLYLMVIGISTLGLKPTEISNYLKPLLDFAISVIPSSQLSSTPIFLLATAGMRLIPTIEQDSILSATCKVLNSSPFLKSDCSQNVRIITGEEEGLYGWVAVNYLMDGFDKHEHSPDSSSGHGSTYGFLDMGGASTQIAFEPNEVERIKHADNLVEVKLKLLSGKEVYHPVFVTTWLGFGTNQARDRYIDLAIKNHLAKTSPSTATIDDSLSSSPSTTDSKNNPVIIIEDPCLPKSLLLSAPKHESYTLKGTGDFALCVLSTGPLLNKEVKCLDEPCLFNGAHVPKIDFSVNHFIGISEYWYALQDIWSMGGVYDFVTFEKNAFEYCEREWDDIMDDHKKGEKWRSTVELGRLESQCFKAAWVINVLHEGIGIPRFKIDSDGAGDGSDQAEKGKKAKEKGLLPPHFQSVNTVGEVAVSWTLGKMVLEVSKSAPDAEDSLSTSPSSPLDRLKWDGRVSAWSGDLGDKLSSISNTDLVPISGIIILALVGLFLYFSRKASNRNSNYSGGSHFTLLSQEVGGSIPQSSTLASSSRQIRRKLSSSTSNSFLNKLINPIRWAAFVLSSTVRSYTRRYPLSPISSNSTTLLPMRSNPYPYPPAQNRPVAPPPRRANTSPFIRPPIVIGGGLGSTTSSYYNDAPEFISSRNVGVGGGLNRTQSASQLNNFSNSNNNNNNNSCNLSINTNSNSSINNLPHQQQQQQQQQPSSYLVNSTCTTAPSSFNSRPTTPSPLNSSPTTYRTYPTSNNPYSPQAPPPPHSSIRNLKQDLLQTNIFAVGREQEGTLTPPSSFMAGDGAKLRSNSSRSGTSSPVEFES